MDNILVIGIAGGSGSGKTTLMKRLVERFGNNVSVLSHDNYYKRHDELSFEERAILNYDEPGALDNVTRFVTGLGYKTEVIKDGPDYKLVMKK